VAAFPPSAPIEEKFCTAKRIQVPVGRAMFDLNRCNDSPLRGEKPDFSPVSKFNTGSNCRKLKNKSIACKAMQYRQDIVMRMWCYA